MRRPTTVVAASVLSLGLVVAGCGSKNKDEKADNKPAATTTVKATTEDTVAEGVVVSDAWCRTSPKMANVGGCFMVITNSGAEDDELVAASVDESIAAKVELHETTGGGMGATGSTMGDGGHGTTTMADAGHGGDAPAGDMMQMKQVDSIAVPAGGTAELKPGGYHVMLMELADKLDEGSTVELTLKFKNAGEIKVSAEVRSS